MNHGMIIIKYLCLLTCSGKAQAKAQRPARVKRDACMLNLGVNQRVGGTLLRCRRQVNVEDGENRTWSGRRDRI
jgi:hypothetical protein